MPNFRWWRKKNLAFSTEYPDAVKRLFKHYMTTNLSDEDWWTPDQVAEDCLHYAAGGFSALVNYVEDQLEFDLTFDHAEPDPSPVTAEIILTTKYQWLPADELRQLVDAASLVWRVKKERNVLKRHVKT